jgi:O-methyltransferase domain
MSTPSPVNTLLDIAGGYVLPRCLHVVADLGIADVLGDSPRTGRDLAAAVGVDADAIIRVLRLLSAHGVFIVQGDAFAHTPASKRLRSDHPQSMRAFVRMFGLAVFWMTQIALADSVRTGRVAAKDVHPGGFFAYLADHPEASSLFNAAMAAKAGGHIAGVLAAYDFSRFGTIADIGGGSGHLLRAILDAVPAARGVLFELPHVVSGLKDTTPDRLALHAGDFFRDKLPTCDVYLVMEVIHDWNDTEALAILRAIRQAAPRHAPVLVIEQMIPDDPGPHWVKVLDIHMLALLGGRQRSCQEYRRLLEQAGFDFTREIVTEVGVSILEAVSA